MAAGSLEPCELNLIHKEGHKVCYSPLRLIQGWQKPTSEAPICSCVVEKPCPVFFLLQEPLEELKKVRPLEPGSKLRCWCFCLSLPFKNIGTAGFSLLTDNTLTVTLFHNASFQLLEPTAEAVLRRSTYVTSHRSPCISMLMRLHNSHHGSQVQIH